MITAGEMTRVSDEHRAVIDKRNEEYVEALLIDFEKECIRNAKLGHLKATVALSRDIDVNVRLSLGNRLRQLGYDVSIAEPVSPGDKVITWVIKWGEKQ